MRWLILILTVFLLFAGCEDGDGYANKRTPGSERTEQIATPAGEAANLALKAEVEVLKKQVDELARLQRRERPGFGSLLYTLLNLVALLGVAYLLYVHFTGSNPIGKTLASKVSVDGFAREPGEQLSTSSGNEPKKAREHNENVPPPSSGQSPPATSSPTRPPADGPLPIVPAKRDFTGIETGDDVGTSPPVHSPSASSTPTPTADVKPLYAASPANCRFKVSWLEEEPGDFTYYKIIPETGGHYAALELVDDRNLQRQVLDSRSSHTEAIDFLGGGSTAEMVDSTPGRLELEDNSWRIVQRIQVRLS